MKTTTANTFKLSLINFSTAELIHLHSLNTGMSEMILDELKIRRLLNDFLAFAYLQNTNTKTINFTKQASDDKGLQTENYIFHVPSNTTMALGQF